MLNIGPHISIAKGFSNAAKEVIRMDGNTFQFFSRNPRGSNYKDYDEKDISSFQKLRKEYEFGPIQAHAPYTMNLASPKEGVYDFAKTVLKEDTRRMERLEIETICIHPGSHLGSGVQEGIQKIINGLNEAISESERIQILIETMPGKGTEVGATFRQIKDIIDGVKNSERVGVCMDLCHVFSAGYDIKNDIDGVLLEFEQTIGLRQLRSFHLNDSAMPFSSRKDRHKPIGEGEIGAKAAMHIIKRFCEQGIPFYTETPLDFEGHKKEIAMIKMMLKR